MNMQDIENKARKMIAADLSRDDAQTWLAGQPSNGYDPAKAAKLVDDIFNEVRQDNLLPEITISNRTLRDKTSDTLEAINKANIPPSIFERSGTIVRIATDEKTTPYIEVMGESAVRGFVERAANFVRINDKGDTSPLSAPPLEVVRDLMTLPGHHLPALSRITEIPVIRPDGTILNTPGYDPATLLYYVPAKGLEIPEIPEHPTEAQLKTATALFQEPFIDFPFDNESSKANALAAMLTPVCRELISGPVPLCLFDKPQAGTGASLATEIISIITTGRLAAMMGAAKDDEEWEKRLTAILRRGHSIIVIDNLEGTLYSPQLARILTSSRIQGRILGQSEDIILPNRVTYLATGNNVRLAGDLPRRCYLSRMDALSARPWMRDPTQFKHKNLIQWVSENRGAILAAGITMARSWIVYGKPAPSQLPILGSFESWCSTIGGILAHANIKGFLGNLNDMYSKSDVETGQWEAFIADLREVYEKQEFTVSDLVKLIIPGKESNVSDSNLASTLPDSVDRDPKKINRSLGNALSKHAGVRYLNGFMVYKAGERKHAAAWQILNYQKGELPDTNSPDLASKGELGELGLLLYTRDEKNNTYRGETDSLNSPLASKSGELAKELPPDDVQIKF